MKSASSEGQSSDDDDADLLLKWFENHGEDRTELAGEILMSAGETPRWMARIESGIAAVLDGDGAEAHTLSVGDLFGEMGLVGSRVRTATIQAVSPVSLRILSYQAIEKHRGENLEKRSSFDRALSELIASRVLNPAGPDHGWIALVAHDQKKDQLEQLVCQFQEALSRYKIVATRQTGSRALVEVSVACQEVGLFRTSGGRPGDRCDGRSGSTGGGDLSARRALQPCPWIGHRCSGPGLRDR